MCRNIKPLYNFDPPASQAEIHEAALQYVRKISGFRKPSRANQTAFDAAVEAIATASGQLINSLQTEAAPKDRALEATHAHARAIRRFAQ